MEALLEERQEWVGYKVEKILLMGVLIWECEWVGGWVAYLSIKEFELHR